MKLQIMSDLHFEMHADGGAELIRELAPTGVDVLVLAGDITMARHYADLESVFRPLAKKYRHILYVPGNHEYYKSSPTEVARNLANLTRALPQVVIPENDTVVIAGQRFIAGTMWFRADPAAEPSKRLMHDFSLRSREVRALCHERLLRLRHGLPRARAATQALDPRPQPRSMRLPAR